MEKVSYICRICGSTTIVDPYSDAPECCGEEMEPLDVCTEAPHAEMARNYAKDDPCDEGTAGKRV